MEDDANRRERGVTDSHAHLDACDEPAAAVERAAAAGVTRIVTIGTGIDSCRAALALADEHDGVFASLGVDPHQAATAEAGRLDELRELLAHPKAVAVGETGLDNVKLYADARRSNGGCSTSSSRLQPTSTSRSSSTAAKRRPTPRPRWRAFAGTVILHCFSSPDLLPAALERGYYVSFAGNVTYPKAGELREAAAAIPRDRILVETDSPYLSPQPVRGRRNEPAHVVHTIAALAAVRGEEQAELAAATHANAAAAFRLP